MKLQDILYPVLDVARTIVAWPEFREVKRLQNVNFICVVSESKCKVLLFMPVLIICKSHCLGDGGLSKRVLLIQSFFFFSVDPGILVHLIAKYDGLLDNEDGKLY